MLVSYKHEFILFSNESTGSRSVYETFTKNYRTFEFTQKHVHTPLPPGSKDFLPLITVRDPFNRLVSAYHRILQDPPGHAYYGRCVQWDSFEEFLIKYSEWFTSPASDPLGNTLYQCRWIGNHFMTIPWPQDFVYNEVIAQCTQKPVFLHQESLQEDLNKLEFYQGEELPVIGKSDYDLQEFRTEKYISIVRDILESECHLFKYKV
jgi:hypothetical protein